MVIVTAAGLRRGTIIAGMAGTTPCGIGTLPGITVPVMAGIRRGTIAVTIVRGATTDGMLPAITM